MLIVVVVDVVVVVVVAVVVFLCREGAKCHKAAAMPCNHEDGVLKRRCAVLGNPQPTRLLAGFRDSRHRPCFYEIALREAKSAEVGCSEISSTVKMLLIRV